MSKKIIAGLIVAAIVLVFVVYPMWETKQNAVQGSLTVTHYDENGDPIESGFPFFAFYIDGVKVSESWDLDIDYTVSGSNYKDLSVITQFEITVLERTYSLQLNEWVDTEIYHASPVGVRSITETGGIGLNFDYSQIVTDPDMEAIYVFKVSATVTASAQSTESAETLGSTWSDSTSWEVEWQDDGSITVEGTLIAP